MKKQTDVTRSIPSDSPADSEGVCPCVHDVQDLENQLGSWLNSWIEERTPALLQALRLIQPVGRQS